MSLVTRRSTLRRFLRWKRRSNFSPGTRRGHYSLATAYARTGRKEDAEREFALQQQTTERAGGQGAQNPQ